MQPPATCHVRATKSLQLTVFSVGNGCCLTIRFPDESIGVIDFNSRCSNQAHPLVGVLPNAAPHSVRFVCLTHPHKDHMDGMHAILDAGSCRGARFVHAMGSIADLIEAFHELPERFPLDHPDAWASVMRLVYLAQSLMALPPGACVSVCASGSEADEALSSADTSEIITVCGPDRRSTEDFKAMVDNIRSGLRLTVSSDAINDASVAMVIEYAGRRLLLPGDVSACCLSRLVVQEGQGCGATDLYQNIDVYLAAHHGSRSSYRPGLLDDLFGNRPGIVLISADGKTRPSRELLDAIAARRERGLPDQVHCTGPIDFSQLPGSHTAVQNWLIDNYAPVVDHPHIASCGPITLEVDADGNMEVRQPWGVPAYGLGRYAGAVAVAGQ